MFHLRQCQRETRTRVDRYVRASRIMPRDDGAGDVDMSRCWGMSSRESFRSSGQNHQQNNKCPPSGYGAPASRQPIGAVRLGFGIHAIHHGIIISCIAEMGCARDADRPSVTWLTYVHDCVSRAEFPLFTGENCCFPQQIHSLHGQKQYLDQ
jgi:hypothetical protein